jgi:hypothetical protein
MTDVNASSLRNPSDFREGADFERRALEAFAVSFFKTAETLERDHLHGALRCPDHCLETLVTLRLFWETAVALSDCSSARCVWDTELARHLHHGTAEAHAHEEPLRCLVPLGG